MAKEKRYDLRAFASEHGLAVGKHCCYGEYGGYRIHIRYRTLGNPPCLLTIVTDTSGRNKDLEKYLERHKKELKISAFGVVVSYASPAPRRTPTTIEWSPSGTAGIDRSSSALTIATISAGAYFVYSPA